MSSIPVLSGWFDGDELFYITFGVSHADVAQAKGANFAPRLAFALPEGSAGPGRSSVDKVYAVSTTRVVLNCPIVHRGPKGALPGVSITHLPR